MATAIMVTIVYAWALRFPTSCRACGHHDVRSWVIQCDSSTGYRDAYAVFISRTSTLHPSIAPPSAPLPAHSPCSLLLTAAMASFAKIAAVLLVLALVSAPALEARELKGAQVTIANCRQAPLVARDGSLCHQLAQRRNFAFACVCAKH
jgi:hypothetical protein